MNIWLLGFMLIGIRSILEKFTTFQCIRMLIKLYKSESSIAQSSKESDKLLWLDYTTGIP